MVKKINTFIIHHMTEYIQNLIIQYDGKKMIRVSLGDGDTYRLAEGEKIEWYIVFKYHMRTKRDGRGIERKKRSFNPCIRPRQQQPEVAVPASGQNDPFLGKFTR